MNHLQASTGYPSQDEAIGSGGFPTEMWPSRSRQSCRPRLVAMGAPPLVEKKARHAVGPMVGRGLQVAIWHALIGVWSVK